MVLVSDQPLPKTPTYYRAISPELLSLAEYFESRDLSIRQRDLQMQNDHGRELKGRLCNDDDARKGTGCQLCVERYNDWLIEREMEALYEGN